MFRRDFLNEDGRTLPLFSPSVSRVPPFPILFLIFLCAVQSFPARRVLPGTPCQLSLAYAPERRQIFYTLNFRRSSSALRFVWPPSTPGRGAGGIGFPSYSSRLSQSLPYGHRKRKNPRSFSGFHLVFFIRPHGPLKAGTHFLNSALPDRPVGTTVSLEDNLVPVPPLPPA